MQNGDADLGVAVLLPGPYASQSGWLGVGLEGKAQTQTEDAITIWLSPAGVGAGDFKYTTAVGTIRMKQAVVDA